MEESNIIDIYIPDDQQLPYAKLKDKYNPEGSDLRIYQNHLTKTMVEFDHFCKNNGLDYSIAYGTMLGAVRHKGFIPWDDDADLFMNRRNYEKLLKLMRGEHHELTPSLSVAMGIRPELWSPPFAYIDIFILDPSPDNIILRYIKQVAAEIAYCLVKARGRIDSNNSKVIKKIRPWYLFIPFALFAKETRWKTIMNNVALWFSNSKSSYYQCYNCSFAGIKQRLRKVDCETIGLIEFENYNFPCFMGYDSLLTVSYGDYMKLPSKLHIHGTIDSINMDNFKNSSIDE